MPTLKDVAQRSNVTLLTAYNALKNAEQVDSHTRQMVAQAAADLGYRLHITIRDVALLAEVSTATVSYVLNNSQPVGATTRERVLEAVTVLGYRPNSTARNLQASKTHLLGYAWYDLPPGVTNAVLDRFTFALATAVEARGYHLLTFAQPAVDLTLPFDELIKTNRVDGFVVINTNRNDPRIRHLIDIKFPFVAFGRANDAWNFPYVDVDGRRGIELATQHLIENGHERIACMGWPVGSLSGDARVQGYLDAMRKAGFIVRPEWVVRTTNFPEAGYQAAQKITDLPAVIRPTAIVCLSDMMALGVMNWLTHCGLEVGADVALTGFDDDPTSAFLRPPLTSVAQPVIESAQQIAWMLFSLLDNEPLDQRTVLLSPTLTIRASSLRKAT